MSDIKFKEIKPGMVIHCPTEEEADILLAHLDKLGYTWNGGNNLLNNNFYDVYGENTSYEIIPHGRVRYGRVKDFASDEYEIKEFSDLVEPELSAEEVLDIVHSICMEDESKCSEKCKLHEYCILQDYGIDGYKMEKVIEICQKWKAEHEKKEPEVEWHYVATVSSAVSTSTKNCKTEEEAIAYIEEELKRLNNDSYCGKYERVCRIKEV